MSQFISFLSVPPSGLPWGNISTGSMFREKPASEPRSLFSGRARESFFLRLRPCMPVLVHLCPVPSSQSHDLEGSLSPESCRSLLPRGSPSVIQWKMRVIRWWPWCDGKLSCAGFTSKGRAAGMSRSCCSFWAEPLTMRRSTGGAGWGRVRVHFQARGAPGPLGVQVQPSRRQRGAGAQGSGWGQDVRLGVTTYTWSFKPRD